MKQMNDCNKCIWARRDGGCNSWDCNFIAMDEVVIREERKTEWIPTSERLPEEYGEYLVTKRTIGWNCEEYDSNDIAYFDSDGFHKADKVTAWMPLPEPYKEDSCNGCDYLGESCVGEGCGKLTERKDGEA